MHLFDALAAAPRILAEGSVFELVRRDPRTRFDASVAHAGLIYEQPELLAAVHRDYLDIAAGHRVPIVAFTDTWRASATRIEASRFHGRDVNGDNVAFLRSLAGGRDVVVAGMSGPRGDAYKPSEAPHGDAARRYHAAQIERLAAAGVDLLAAATLPSVCEARAIASLMADTGIPWMLSFVIRADGTTLDGTPLGDAIRSIDESVSRPAAGYAVNCVHPSVLERAGVANRLLAFQPNTSRLAPEDLDGREDLDSAEPDEFAADVMNAAGEIRIVGGCCGTDARHISAIAERLGA